MALAHGLASSLASLPFLSLSLSLPILPLQIPLSLLPSFPSHLRPRPHTLPIVVVLLIYDPTTYITLHSGVSLPFDFTATSKHLLYHIRGQYLFFNSSFPFYPVLKVCSWYPSVLLTSFVPRSFVLPSFATDSSSAGVGGEGVIG